MAVTIKLEAYYVDDDASDDVKERAKGFDSADLRGALYLGKDQGEHHTTIAEEEFGADVETNERVEEVLRDAPAWNRQTAAMLKGLVPASPFVEVLARAFNIDSESGGLRLSVKDQ